MDDTVRAARLSSQAGKPWIWGSLTAGVLGAAAALMIALLPEAHNSEPTSGSVVEISPRAQEIEEIAETEALIAAVEHIDEFSDTELVALIGF